MLRQERRLFSLSTGIGLLVISLFCAGCNPAENRYPGYLTLRLSANPTTLDPALITDVTGGSIAAKIFNGLVRFNESLEIVPDLASAWSLAPDQRTYTFHLKRNIHFSNGRELTAGDVRFSFERVLDRRTRAPLTWVLDRIEGATDFMEGRSKRVSGITVLDTRTLRIRLRSPFAPFLSLLGMTTASVVPSEEVSNSGTEFGLHPVGTGPFVLKDWQHGQDVVLSARQDYFEGPPPVAGIRYRVIPEDLTAVMEFETGRIDILSVPASEFRRYTMDPKWKDGVRSAPGINTYYMGMNCGRPPFNDLRMRQAATMAVDRQRILDTVYEKRGILATGPVPPALQDHAGNGRMSSDLYPFDPVRARKLVREAGWEDKPFSLYISAEPEILDIVEVIQYYLQKSGMAARIVQLDWSAFKQAVNRGEAEAFWLSWWADYPDPENFLYPLFHSSNAGPAGNRSWFSDKRVDRLIDQARSTMDSDLRASLYRKAEGRIRKQAPWVFFWHRSDIAVLQPWVSGYRIPPIYSIDKGMTASISR